jgi:type II secretory pathway component GspD/PulD (secretin)
MLRWIMVPLLLASSCMVAAGQTRESSGGRSGFGSQEQSQFSRRPPTERGARSAGLTVPLKSPGPLLKLEVVIAEVDSSGAEKIAAEAVSQLEQQGKLSSLMRISLLTLNNQSAFAQRGLRLPVATGRTSVPAGPSREASVATAYQMMNVGAIIGATATVDDEGFIVAALDAEISSAPSTTAGTGQGQPEVGRPIPVSVTIQTTLRLEPGKPVIFAELHSDDSDETKRQLLLATGTIVGGMPAKAAAAPAEPAIETRIFVLRNVNASSAAGVIEAVFGGERSLRTAAVHDNNSLLLRGSGEVLAEITDVLLRLDGEKRQAARE